MPSPRAARPLFALLSAAALLGCGDKDPDAATDTGAAPATTDADADGFDAADDCDDNDAAVFPGAAELCNGVDDDCDDAIDEDPTDGAAWFRDSDGDGFGDGTVSALACAAPAGFVGDDTDCDDTDPAIHPDAVEEDCTDPVDYNCDGSVGYADADADGVPACEDCDDTDPAIRPGAAEVCNDGVDDDCDGEADEAGAAGETVWYADVDGDGYGDPLAPVLACDAPSWAVADGTDCDDSSTDANPAGVEVCDALDNDCDGRIDGADAADATLWYPDGDGDGHGAAAPSVAACEAPAFFVASSDDCDDGAATSSPSATEVCDRVDNDCDGDVDEGLTATYYADPDGDGYGVAGVSVEACSAGTGFAPLAGDCDEADPAIHPGATEVCDGSDNDCDGDTDDADASLDLSSATPWYADLDGDGFGDSTSFTRTCVQPSATVPDDTDCDDDAVDVNPDATEVWYDGVDADCDATSDYDADGDGYDSDAHGGTDEDDADPSCWTGCTPGLTQADAAASCVDVLSVDPAAPDGTYWIDPNDDGVTSDAFEVECDMANGGWALCFALENTSGEDLNDNSWFDDCLDMTGATWTGQGVRIQLEDPAGAVLYAGEGDRAGHTWSASAITSTTGMSTQYYSWNHGRLVSLDTGDKLMITAQASANNGCGGSFGNGYGIVVYPSSPDYVSNPKMIVMPYRHQTSPSGSPRSFTGWSTSSEIAFNGGSSWGSCSTSPAQLGTFTFWVR